MDTSVTPAVPLYSQEHEAFVWDVHVHITCCNVNLKGYQVCIPMVHSRRGTLQGGSHGQSPHSPWAAGDWWKTGTQGGRLSERMRDRIVSIGID